MSVPSWERTGTKCLADKARIQARVLNLDPMIRQMSRQLGQPIGPL